MTIRVGLCSRTEKVGLDAIRKAAAALDTQVKRDLKPIWDIDAEVVPLDDPLRIPRGVHPIIVLDQTPGMVGGLHTEAENGTPFAIVLSSRDWGLAASHECIEMLIDPTGNERRTSIALDVVDGVVREIEGTVDYLLEACDPIEDIDHAYQIGDITVTDFYTPHYFDAAAKPGVRYSFNGALTAPRQVRTNGYLSWHHPGLNRFQQLTMRGPARIITLPDHGQAGAEPGNSMREFVDRHTDTPRLNPPHHHA